jgi:hypothetical protein
MNSRYRKNMSKKRMSKKNYSKKDYSKKIKRSSSKKLRKTKTQKRKQMKMRLYNSQRGGNILPSSISHLGYTVLGTGQSIVDGWNGKSSSFSYVNASPESQIPIDGVYKSNHNII